MDTTGLRSGRVQTQDPGGNRRLWGYVSAGYLFCGYLQFSLTQIGYGYLFERIWIYGYFATDIRRICVNLILFFLKFYFMSSVYIRHRHKLQSYRVSIITKTDPVVSGEWRRFRVFIKTIQNDASRHTLWVKKRHRQLEANVFDSRSNCTGVGRELHHNPNPNADHNPWLWLGGEIFQECQLY